MRENRPYGSEGGAAELNRPSLPLYHISLGQHLVVTHISDPCLLARQVHKFGRLPWETRGILETPAALAAGE